MTSRRDGPYGANKNVIVHIGAYKKLFTVKPFRFDCTVFFNDLQRRPTKNWKRLYKQYSLYNTTTPYYIKMEKKLNSRTEEYITKFKDDIRTKLIQLGIAEKEKANELLEFVYEYDRLVFSKDDISKRKRIQNSIPTQNRCNARRADNKQCTRKRKDGYEFCGTHSKGAPYGMADDTCGECTKKLDVVAKDVNGIVYYIDKFNNVYKTEDILAGKTNPAVIAKCVVSSSGGITIPGI